MNQLVSFRSAEVPLQTARAHRGTVGWPMSDPGRFCCKSRKLQGPEFFAKIRNGKRSMIRITSIALSKSPVSLTSGDEVPHIRACSPLNF
jgi:hypothetical protein